MAIGGRHKASKWLKMAINGPFVAISRSGAEAPVSSEFLSLLRISEFFGFQWQKLAEILSLFKLYNNLGKVAVRVKLWLIIYCGHLVEWIVK